VIFVLKKQHKTTQALPGGNTRPCAPEHEPKVERMVLEDDIKNNQYGMIMIKLYFLFDLKVKI
jgi:hypothetical protein